MKLARTLLIAALPLALAAGCETGREDVATVDTTAQAQRSASQAAADAEQAAAQAARSAQAAEQAAAEARAAGDKADRAFRQGMRK